MCGDAWWTAVLSASANPAAHHAQTQRNLLYTALKTVVNCQSKYSWYCVCSPASCPFAFVPQDPAAGTSAQGLLGVLSKACQSHCFAMGIDEKRYLTLLPERQDSITTLITFATIADGENDWQPCCLMKASVRCNGLTTTSPDLASTL